MPSIQDITIVNSNTAAAKKVEHGLERVLCSPELCDSKNLTVYKRTIQNGKRYEIEADDNYHLVYVMNSPSQGAVEFKNERHAAEEGAGVLLAPGEAARFDAAGGDLDLLHMVVPKPPAAVEEGLPLRDLFPPAHDPGVNDRPQRLIRRDDRLLGQYRQQDAAHSGGIHESRAPDL
jgi:hypothetical protein